MEDFIERINLLTLSTRRKLYLYDCREWYLKSAEEELMNEIDTVLRMLPDDFPFDIDFTVGESGGVLCIPNAYFISVVPDQFSFCYEDFNGKSYELFCAHPKSEEFDKALKRFIGQNQLLFQTQF